MGLLPGVVLRQVLHSLNALLDGSHGGVVRFEVAVLAGNQVATLARLRVFDSREDIAEGVQHLIGVVDPSIILVHLEYVPIPKPGTKNKQDDERPSTDCESLLESGTARRQRSYGLRVIRRVSGRWRNRGSRGIGRQILHRHQHCAG